MAEASHTVSEASQPMAEVSITVATLKNSDIVVQLPVAFALADLKAAIVKNVGADDQFRLRCGRDNLSKKIEDLPAFIAGRKVTMEKQQTVEPIHQARLKLQRGDIQKARSHPTLNAVKQDTTAILQQGRDTCQKLDDLKPFIEKTIVEVMTGRVNESALDGSSLTEKRNFFLEAARNNQSIANVHGAAKADENHERKLLTMKPEATELLKKRKRDRDAVAQSKHLKKEETQKLMALASDHKPLFNIFRRLGLTTVTDAMKYFTAELDDFAQASSKDKCTLFKDLESMYPNRLELDQSLEYIKNKQNGPSSSVPPASPQKEVQIAASSVVVESVPASPPKDVKPSTLNFYGFPHKHVVAQPLQSYVDETKQLTLTDACGFPALHASYTQPPSFVDKTQQLFLTNQLTVKKKGPNIWYDRMLGARQPPLF